MNRFLRTSFVLFLLVSCLKTFPQGVGINNSGIPADSSAIMDISSTDQGLLIPRMTEAQRNQIQNPAHGLIILNLDTECFNIYLGNIWYEICPDCIAPPAPVVTNNGPVCEGDTIFLSASSIPNASYLWSGPGGYTSSLQNPVIPGASLSMTGSYSVIASLNNCSGIPVSTNVSIVPLPSSAFTYSPNPGSTNFPVDFTATLSGAAYTWAFQSGSPANSNIQNPSVTWSAPGTYTVTLTVVSNGCSSTTTSQIIVVDCYNHGQTATFSYTGNQQSWTVPSGVCSINIEAWGGQGGRNGNNQQVGGLGGYAEGDLVVNPGDVLYIFVGGSGDNGGYNGGGSCVGGWTGGKGGGASDVRVGGISLSNRVIVAGGGGGAAGYSAGYGGWNGGQGGNGGGYTGSAGITNVPYGGGGAPGQGGTSSAGGSYGIDGSNAGGCITGSAGTLGVGGSAGGNAVDCGSGGSGGGGYYGGGGGGFGNCGGGGGGGGSSYTGGVTSGSTQAGLRSGNGQILIHY